jgi:ABC-type sugar transport system ATPase subunit
MRVAESEPYVEVAKVSKVYRSGGADAVEAVSSVSFGVLRGQFVAILGPSGCGKSTLLMMVGGLEPVTAGTISIGGAPMTGPRTSVGVMFQDPTLLPWKSAIDNVLFPLRVLKRPLDARACQGDDEGARHRSRNRARVQTIATQTKTLESDPALCEAITDRLLEALAYTLTNPQDSLELFLKEVPELALNSSSREFARIGLGMWHHGVDHPEPREHGLGWSDPVAYSKVTDLVMEYLASPGMQRPGPASLFTNRFAGKIKLDGPEWARIHERVSEFDKYLS